MNAQAKYTAGPWRVTKDERTDGGRKSADCWIIDSPTRKFMASLEVWELNQDPRWRAAHPEAVAEHAETMCEVEANARLIAAAPELAMAALSAREMLGEMLRTAASNDQADAINEVSSALTAALAKAGLLS